MKYSNRTVTYFIWMKTSIENYIITFTKDKSVLDKYSYDYYIEQFDHCRWDRLPIDNL